MHRIIDSTNSRIVEIVLPRHAHRIETKQEADVSVRDQRLDLQLVPHLLECRTEVPDTSDGDDLDSASVEVSDVVRLYRRKRRGSQSGQRHSGCTLRTITASLAGTGEMHGDSDTLLASDKSAEQVGNINVQDELVTIPYLQSPVSSTLHSPNSSPRGSESSVASAVSSLALRRGFHIQPFEEASLPFQTSVKIKAKSRSFETEEAISPGTLVLLAARQRQVMRTRSRVPWVSADQPPRSVY